MVAFMAIADTVWVVVVLTVNVKPAGAAGIVVYMFLLNLTITLVPPVLVWAEVNVGASPGDTQLLTVWSGNVTTAPLSSAFSRVPGGLSYFTLTVSRDPTSAFARVRSTFVS